MRQFIYTAALAVAVGSVAFTASACPRHAGLNLENTWSGVNGATRNHNAGWRYKTGVDFTKTHHGKHHSRHAQADKMPWHDAPPPRPARVMKRYDAASPPPPPAEPKRRWFWQD